MSIDSYYESVIAKLTSENRIKDVSFKLLSLKTEHERVLFVYNIFEELNAFPSVKEVKKNDDQSVCYRNRGNTFFTKSQFYKAWQYYNLSLLYATNNSENFCVALSNRSAVFFTLEKYNECIKDIDTVFSLPYPKKLQEKLSKRKVSCNNALSEKETTKTNNIKIEDILKMKTQKDPIFIAASSKLEVEYSEEMGRHVVAKEDINVGEIIVEEEPYLAILLKNQHLVACSYCLSRCLNLMPCDTCCFCLYCSDECKAKAWKDFHETECPLMATLFQMDFTKLELLALRTVIRARTDHLNWNDLFKTIEAADGLNNTKFHGQVKDGDNWRYDSKCYASIHSLATNADKRSISDTFQKAVTAAVFLKFLRCDTSFMIPDCEDQQDSVLQCVARLLLIHEMTTPTNMHSIASNMGDESGKSVDEVNLGCAPYAFCSLINHSCAPNVTRCTKLGTARMLVTALRPIKKGMQIFDNYGFHHAVMDRRSRHNSLKSQYKFICACEACIDNWPTYMELNLRKSTKVPNKIVAAKEKLLPMKIINELQYGKVDTALCVYHKLCKLCESLEKYAPCVELCDCQEALKQCLSIFEGHVPYGSDLMVENHLF